MTTRRNLILCKYNELKEQISDITIQGRFLPNSDDIDLADYLFLISYQFMNVNTDMEYIVTVRSLLVNNACEISEDEFEKVFPLIREFIIWFKTLK